MSSQKRLLSGSFFSLLAMLLDKAHLFIVSLAVARLLGSEELGGYSLLQSTSVMLATISTAGLSSAATRYCGKLKIDNPRQLGNTLTMLTVLFVGLLIGIILLIVISPWGVFDFDAVAIEIADVTLVLIVLCVIQATVMLCMNVLRGMEEFRSISQIMLTRSLISLPVTLLLTWLFGFDGAVAGLLIYFLTWLFFLGFQTYKTFRRFHVRLYLPRLSHVAVMWGVFGLTAPFTLASIMSAGFNWTVRMLIAESPTGLQGVGVFAAVSQYAMLFTVITGALGIAVVPLLSSQLDDKDAWCESFSLFFKNCLRVTLPAIVFLEVLAPYLLMIFGEDFSGEVLFARLFLLAFALNGLVWTLGPVMLATGKGWFYLLLSSLRFFTALGISWYFLVEDYFHLMPIGFIISDLIVGAVVVFVYYRKRNLKISLNSSDFKVVMFTLLVLVPVFVLDNWMNLVWGGISLIALIISLWKTMSADERDLVTRKLGLVGRYF